MSQYTFFLLTCSSNDKYLWKKYTLTVGLFSSVTRFGLNFATFVNFQIFDGLFGKNFNPTLAIFVYLGEMFLL